MNQTNHLLCQHYNLQHNAFVNARAQFSSKVQNVFVSFCMSLPETLAEIIRKFTFDQM